MTVSKVYGNRCRGDKRVSQKNLMYIMCNIAWCIFLPHTYRYLCLMYKNDLCVTLVPINHIRITQLFLCNILGVYFLNGYKLLDWYFSVFFFWQIKHVRREHPAGHTDMEPGWNIIAGHDVRWCGALHPPVPGDSTHWEHRRIFSICLSRFTCGKHPQNIVLVKISLLFL